MIQLAEALCHISNPMHRQYSRRTCIHRPLQVTAQKFEDPATGEETVTKKLEELNEQIKESFRNLEEDYR